MEGVAPTFDGSSVAADHPLRKLAEGIGDRYAVHGEDGLRSKNIIMEFVQLTTTLRTLLLGRWQRSRERASELSAEIIYTLL